MTVASRLYAAMQRTGPAVTRDVDVRRDVVVGAPGGAGLLTSANRRTYYQGGAFAPERAPGWAFALENQERPLGLVTAPLRARRALTPALGHLPLLDADAVAVGHPVGFYRDWLTHQASGDPYWAPTPATRATRAAASPSRPRPPCTPRGSPCTTTPRTRRRSCCPSSPARVSRPGRRPGRR